MLAIERGSFAGHETFTFRYAWLRKAVQAVAEDPGIFRQDEAMVRLGVGKNMVRSIRHWGLVCGLIGEDSSSNNRGRSLRVTPLGARLMGEAGWDPYLEDPASLWILHWQLATTPDGATTWYWVFNECTRSEFSKDDLVDALASLAREREWARVSPDSLKRDVDCFIRTYVAARPSSTLPVEDTLDCPLVELSLIREVDRSFYLQRGEQPTLPDELVAYGLVDSMRRKKLSARTIPLEQIVSGAGSLARVFCLSEESLLVRLERLDDVTDGALVFDETAGLRQVLVRNQPDPFELLAQYYNRRPDDDRRAGSRRSARKLSSPRRARGD